MAGSDVAAAVGGSSGGGAGVSSTTVALVSTGGAPGALRSIVYVLIDDSPFAPDSMLVVSSSGTRGDEDRQYQMRLQEQAHAGVRLATMLVEAAARRGAPSEDLLSVVVRQRADRPSMPLLSPPS